MQIGVLLTTSKAAACVLPVCVACVLPVCAACVLPVCVCQPQEAREAAYVDMDQANEEKDKGNAGEGGGWG